MASKSQDDIRTAITNQIIEAIEQGELPPWRRTWNHDPSMPISHSSLSTGKAYQGINSLILQCAAMRFGYESRWWGTFNQIRSRNSSVGKGEKGHRIILWKPINKTRIDRQGNETDESFMVMKEFVVFNAEQTKGIESISMGNATTETTDIERHEDADRLIDSLGAKIVFGHNQPGYRPHDDTVLLPRPGQFHSPEAYYETAFHEIIHWCDHGGRIEKQTERDYSFCELVAEIGACQLMTEMGIPLTDFSNNAAYLEGWLRNLHDDNRFIFAASARASKCVDFILSFSATNADLQEPVAA